MRNPELTTSEPYVMGSHATCSGAWVSGPEDLSPSEYFWGYNRMLRLLKVFLELVIQLVVVHINSLLDHLQKDDLQQKLQSNIYLI